MSNINELFRRVILANELEGSLAHALCFSDPDGVRSGKSGWSFGVCQFDTKNNNTSISCLKECGFSQAEISGIVNQNIDVKPLNAKLAANASIIEKYDIRQLSYCVERAQDFAQHRGIKLADPSGILGLADYINQYGVPGDGSAAYYKGLGRAVTAEDVLDFKLKNTKYGKEHPADCKRRFDNIKKVLASC